MAQFFFCKLSSSSAAARPQQPNDIQIILSYWDKVKYQSVYEHIFMYMHFTWLYCNIKCKNMLKKNKLVLMLTCKRMVPLFKYLFNIMTVMLYIIHIYTCLNIPFNLKIHKKNPCKTSKFCVPSLDEFGWCEFLISAFHSTWKPVSHSHRNQSIGKYKKYKELRINILICTYRS